MKQEGPLRLAPLHQAALKAAQPRVVNVGKEAWVSFELNDATGTTRQMLTCAVQPFHADTVSEIRLNLKSRGPGSCMLTWVSDLEPARSFEPAISGKRGVAIPLYPDETFHEYVVSLGSAESETWAGLISELILIPLDSSPLPEVQNVLLMNTPPKGPRRTTINDVTHVSMFGSLAPWRLTVPKNAVFEAYVGFLPRTWDPPYKGQEWSQLAAAAVPWRSPPVADGARFRVSLQQVKGESVTLLERDVNPAANEADRSWIRVSADLSPYTGKEVVLSLQVFPKSNSVRDYALWGSPIVYQHAPAGNATPVILISCDTLRADHVSSYGYGRKTTPNLDNFAADSVLFENAVTPETWTLTAHMTMLTGLHPRRHGVSANTNMSESIPTLPGVLAEANYLTAGFTGHQAWMLPWRGLAFGFDTYTTPRDVWSIFDSESRVNAWLDSHPTPRFFLFWHNYDIHSRFAESGCADCDHVYYPPDKKFLHFSKEFPEPPTLRDPEGKRPRGTDLLWNLVEGNESITPDELNALVALYDDSIRAVDHVLGEFFARLKQEGLYDDALIIVTADHGEHFGEHGQYMHVHIYEGALRVPLIVKFPRSEKAGTRFKPMVQLEDIMPTVLDVLGLPPRDSDGRSLRAVLNDTVQPAEFAFSRRFSYRAVRRNDWKLIRDLSGKKRPEFYNIASDPTETANLYASNPPLLVSMNAELDAFYLENPKGWHVAFDSANSDWRGTLTITTNGRFETSKLIYGIAMGKPELLSGDDQRMTVSLGILPKDELLLRTIPDNAPILLSVDSESEFSVMKGNDQPHLGKHYQTVLDLTEPTQKPIALPDGNVPSLRIWREEDAPEGSEAQALTEEQKQALRDLGYLGSD